MKIRNIKAMEILDSRGNPTVCAYVETENGIIEKACAPAGASKGKYEAKEKRDGDERCNGKGVLKAVKSIKNEISDAVLKADVEEQREIDARLRSLYEMTAGEIGANATIAVSMACAKAGAKSLGLPLFRYLSGVYKNRLPAPMMNVLNGGQHADNNLDIQEFMIVPRKETDTAGAIRMCSEIYQELKKALSEDGHKVSVGDEGGFAPNLENDEAALMYLMKACERAKYAPGRDVFFAIDAAASSWKKENGYVMPKSGKEYGRESLTEYYSNLVKKYPIISIEDGMDEEDFDGFRLLTRKLGKSVMIVGDDLFVTDRGRIEGAYTAGCANAVLIKPNQTGTVTGAMEAVKAAERKGMMTIASHRSGDTEDSFITDFAVGAGCGYLKAGAPARSERCAKYNRLLEIEAFY